MKLHKISVSTDNSELITSLHPWLGTVDKSEPIHHMYAFRQPI